ncbi:echinoidin-like [Diadema setosum]|uniref:echinoidin-like n=1 Tax=Diadema setosum TaxID=31175 RepID=UPI003B3AF1E6
MYAVAALTLLLLGTVAEATEVAAGSRCPPLWTGFKGNCYRYFNRLNQWYNSELFCRSFSVPPSGSGQGAFGHLVSIHSREEQDFVCQLFRTSSEYQADKNMWIGLKDFRDEGNFTWSDGTKFDYTDWSVGSSDGTNAGGDNCVAVKRGTLEKNWNVVPCGESRNVEHIVCKLPMW